MVTLASTQMTHWKGGAWRPREGSLKYQYFQTLKSTVWSWKTYRMLFLFPYENTWCVQKCLVLYQGKKRKSERRGKIKMGKRITHKSHRMRERISEFWAIGVAQFKHDGLAPDEQNLILKTNAVDGESWLLRVVFRPPRDRWGMHVPSPPHTHWNKRHKNVINF